MNTGIGLKTLSGEDIALKAVSINGKLNGILAEINVEQKFQNNEDNNIEAVYTFPLPIDAVLMSLTVEINGEILEGIVKASARAEEDYEDAIVSGDTAVMLKKLKDGLYAMNVGNLLAGESASINFRYAQLHQWQGDSLRLYIPTTLAPKYGDPISTGIAEYEIPRHTLTTPYRFDLLIAIEGQLADATISSPTHAIRKHVDSKGVHFSFDQETQAMDRDFILELAKPTNYLGEGLWAQDGDKIVALTSFYPQIDKSQQSSKRCIKMVVDCSGSMAGDSIEQAQVALHEIVSQLNADDWFNIILFGSSHHSLFTDSVRANNTNLRLADKALRSLNANLGGTELRAALSAAYESATPCQIPTDILLITDGQIWDEQQLIKTAKASQHRHFIVGVGSAVSHALLSKLATETGGACEFVTPNENMNKRIVRHFARIKQPKLHNSHITWTDKNGVVGSIMQSPEHLGTLFSGDTINAFSWFNELNDHKAALTFFCGNDQALEADVRNYNYPITLVERKDDKSTLARLAAHSRLSQLAASEAESLAERYQLVTEFTHYILVKTNELRNEVGLPVLRQVPHQWAAGHSGLGSVHEMMDSCYENKVCFKESSYLDIPAFSRKTVDMRTQSSILADVLNNECTPDNSMNFNESSYLDIPAFLRKEVDMSTSVAQFSTLADALNNEFTPDNSMDIPKFDIGDLQERGEDYVIIEALNALVQLGYAEHNVVAAWLSLYNELNPNAGFTRHVTRLIRLLCKNLDISEELNSAVKNAMKAKYGFCV